MSDAEKFLDAHPPAFSLDEIATIAKDHFGLTGHMRLLWGERDQNVMIEGCADGDVVLKITNEREAPETVDLHISAMRHLAVTSPALPIARIIPTKSGQAVAELRTASGIAHMVYVCSRLSGTPCNGVELGSGKEKTLFAIGAMAGRLSGGLQGFFHPSAGDPLFWDVRQLPSTKDGAAGISDPALREKVLELGNSLVMPLLPELLSLRSQAIHHDINQGNVLVNPSDPTQITGLIDFGDMIHGTIAQDVAVCATELAFGSNEVLKDTMAVVTGYDSTFELTGNEINLVWDLMVARCVSGLLIGGSRRLHGISSPDNVEYEEQYTPILQQLQSIGREGMRNALRHACRFPSYCPPVSTEKEDTVTGDQLDRRFTILGRHALLSYERPVHTVRGEGAWLFDAAGNRYLDAYNNVPHVGHSHPHVVKAISRQAKALNTNTRYIFESVLEYGERLAELMPGDIGVTLFVNSGSEANDVAQRMALKLTGQSGSLIVDGAYHGITKEIYALSPSNDWGGGDEINARHPSVVRSDIGVLPVPDLLRSTDPGQTLQDHTETCDGIIRQMTEAGYPPGMFMFCSAFSSSGILDLPQSYVLDMTEQVRKAGGMIICDEVQYGFGRSGDRFWGFENYGVTPDAVTLGKPMGNGIATGAVVTTPENVERFTRDSEFFSTFGGNPVACAAANAVLDVIERENLQENARTVGQYMRDSLKACVAAIPGGSDVVADVRGRGLFVGVEIVRDGETLVPDSDACSRIKNHLRNNFVLVGSDGFHGNVLKIRPPMVCTKEQVDILSAAFGEAIEDVLRSRP